jgi:transposase
MARTYARAARGKRIVIPRPGKRFKRLNIVAGQCGGEVIGETFYEWTTNSGWFEVWFEWYFCPYLLPKSVIIMDNARFHRKIELERIAKFYGYTILWLPPYSPDKNRIEHLWANLKNWLRIYSHDFDTIQNAVIDYFKS